MAHPHITFNDLGYGATLVKPVWDNGWQSDERFFQGDDYNHLCYEIDLMEKSWAKGNMAHLFKSLPDALDSYFEAYFN